MLANILAAQHIRETNTARPCSLSKWPDNPGAACPACDLAAPAGEEEIRIWESNRVVFINY